MANFAKDKKRVREGKIGAPTKTGKVRDQWLSKQRATVDELALLKELLAVMKYRRGINSMMDLIMYMAENEYSKQDEIRVIAGSVATKNAGE